jgi:branched-chain amino acid aminotransferase
VLEICRRNGIECIERDLSLTEFYRADEVFCTGTMGELAPVHSIDGRTIGSGEAGPMTQRLSDLYAQLTVKDGEEMLKAE